MGRDHETPDSASKGPAFQRTDAAAEQRSDERSFSSDALSCADALELIPAYLDDELSEPRAAPLRRHLLDCHACREQAQAERALQRWFVPGEPVAVPAGFAARVTQLAFSGARSTDAHLLERRVPVSGAVSVSDFGPEVAPESQRLRSFVLAAVAVAAAVLLTFALALQLRSRPSGEELYADELPALWVPGAGAPQETQPLPSKTGTGQPRPPARPSGSRTSDSRSPDQAPGQTGAQPAGGAGSKP